MMRLLALLLWSSLALAGNGGVLKEVRVPFSWNAPGLTNGIIVYKPKPGERMLPGSFISIPTIAFDGSTPWLQVRFQDETVIDAFILLRADQIDGHHDSLGHMRRPDPRSVYYDAGDYFGDTTPLMLILDDGAGGNPGSTQGEGIVRLLIWAVQ